MTSRTHCDITAGLVAERDEARAEVERLREELRVATAQLRKANEMAAGEKRSRLEWHRRAEQAELELDRLVDQKDASAVLKRLVDVLKERNDAVARAKEVDGKWAARGSLLKASESVNDELLHRAERAEAERDEARADAERLRAKLATAVGGSAWFQTLRDEIADAARREGAREALERVRSSPPMTRLIEGRWYAPTTVILDLVDRIIADYAEPTIHDGEKWATKWETDCEDAEGDDVLRELDREDAEGDDVLRALLAFPPRATKPGDTPYLDALDAAARVLIRRALDGKEDGEA